MKRHKRRRLWSWHRANANPPKPGKYLIRCQWFNKMNGRYFDEWRMCEWTAEGWGIFSGAKVVEWKAV